MKLNQANLASPFWREKGYILPAFDRRKVMEATAKNPEWLHLGAGNIFRAFIAKVMQDTLDRGLAKTGIIVAEGFDYEIIGRAYRAFDNLAVAVSLRASGQIEKTIVGSVTESLVMDSQSPDWTRMEEIFVAPSLKLVSFTITEKGYNLRDVNGDYYPAVREDFKAGPEKAATYIGKLAALLYARYRAGALPLALVSMDNCSHNGGRLYAAVSDYAKNWVGARLADAGFLPYITGGEKVSFPWSAIDKITPRPDESVMRSLEADGLEDVSPVVTSKKTFVAPFVNAEEAQYLVVEDSFPNGRPAFVGEGVYFADRETVDRFEKMKVCTCLNPLHTCLAVFGCLLGYKLISAEMSDPQLRSLVSRIAYDESMPVVTDPKIVRPEDFVATVLNVRFPNPYNPDSPQRIATDTSQKLGIRFGETIKAYLASDSLDVKHLKYIPLVLAGWCRYLMALDDAGQPFEPSPDPMLEEVSAHVKSIRLGEDRDFHAELSPILSNAEIFGVDLYEAGLGKKVEEYFRLLVRGPGAVRRTLEEIVGN
ncbi:MAG: Mannitol 2-dehydrogenase [Betaproteobacteria bacterium ADurb.Bin341]|nr:MAG: Mannitol 2-dehydrogenase [Betaproteobacteria bacterium ADurb.Bin341]